MKTLSNWAFRASCTTITLVIFTGAMIAFSIYAIVNVTKYAIGSVKNKLTSTKGL